MRGKGNGIIGTGLSLGVTRTMDDLCTHTVTREVPVGWAWHVIVGVACNSGCDKRIECSTNKCLHAKTIKNMQTCVL